MSTTDRFVTLDMQHTVWEQCYTVAPLVLIGTKEGDETYDFSPKHMISPLGWDNYFGFVTTERHRTYHNVMETGVFTVSYPGPDQVDLIRQAASPRDEGEKVAMRDLPTVAAQNVDGVLLEGSYLQLECRFERHIDRLGKHSLIIGFIETGRVREELHRTPGDTGSDVIAEMPLLAFIAPDRYARIAESESFPFPAGFDEKKAFPSYLQYFGSDKRRSD